MLKFSRHKLPWQANVQSTTANKFLYYVRLSQGNIYKPTKATKQQFPKS